MPRDFRVYLDDILAAIEKVFRYTAGLSSKSLRSTRKLLDAVIRNLEIVGEATRKCRAKFAQLILKSIGRRSRIARYIDPRVFWHRHDDPMGHRPEQVAATSGTSPPHTYGNEESLRIP